MDKLKIIENSLKKEGTFSNNKYDSGGKTMYGITESVARQYGYTGNISKLTKDIAIEIYSKLYWRKEFELFEENIAEFLFDCNINHGYKGMSIILQKSINYLTKFPSFQLRDKFCFSYLTPLNILYLFSFFNRYPFNFCFC